MKVCIIGFIIAAIFCLLWTNDLYMTIFDILIFILTFFISYNISFYIGKYLQVRRERKNFEIIIERLVKSIDNVPCEQLHTD